MFYSKYIKQSLLYEYILYNSTILCVFVCDNAHNQQESNATIDTQRTEFLYYIKSGYNELDNPG